MVKRLKPYCELFGLLVPHSLQDRVPIDGTQAGAVLLQAVAVADASLLPSLPAGCAIFPV